MNATKLTQRKPLSLLLGITAAFTISSCTEPADKNANNEEAGSYFEINAEGELIRPTGYRTWVYVGTPVTPNDMNNGKAAFPEMHNVYIDPASYDYWKEYGEWRDGTILIKELIDIGSKKAVSGNGYFAGKFIGLEATIKSKSDFPNEPGNWAYFSFTNPSEGTLKDKAAPFPTASCNSCHDSSADEDFVFTQYYPVLSAAKGVGKNLSPEDDGKRKTTSEKKVSKWEPSAPTPTGLDLGIPLEREALFAWLQEGKYRNFANKESAMHESEGPHQALGLPVRVFMNDLAAQSLTTGNEEHPVGAVIIKEMFKEDKTPYGWAVMAKTQKSADGGKGWFWYEVTDSKDSTKVVAHGNGVQGCFKCHASGEDYVLTDFPLK